MKKLLIIFMLFLFPLAKSMAQDNPNKEPKKDKLKALKAAFITQKLDLSTEEAQKFWPLYNQLENERDALQSKNKEMKKEMRKNENLDNEKAKELIENQLTHEQKMLDLKKKFHSQVQGTLPSSKEVQLYRAEKQFHDKVMDKMHERKEAKNRNEHFDMPPPPPNYPSRGNRPSPPPAPENKPARKPR